MIFRSTRSRSEARRARDLIASFESRPTVDTYRSLETVLPADQLRPLALTLHECQPELLYPLVPEIRLLLGVHRPGRLRALVERAIECGDVTGVDLDILPEACFNLVNDRLFREVLSYIAGHAERSVITSATRHPRLPSLVEIYDELDEGWQDRVDAWIGSPDDEMYALKVAMSLKILPPVALLAPRVDLSALTEQQVSRLAVQLWRAGSNELGLKLARAVTTEGTALTRAHTVIAEHDSFELQASGWTPPSLRPEPAYVPDPRSVLHVLQNSLPYRTTGSANRSQGLLAGLVDIGLSSTAITRPGFPYADVPKDERESIVARHTIGGVDYHHVLNGGEILPRFPVQQFISVFAAEIAERARTESAALVHAASNAYNALAGTVAARELGIPSIYEVRALYEEGRRSRDEDFAETPQYQFAQHLETLAATQADRVIAITQGLKDTLVERGVPAEHVHVIPNGVDTERFRPQQRDEELADRYELRGKTVIGYIGSLNWYEGHELLFEAFARLHARHRDVRLLVVGTGERLDTLLRLRAELGLTEEIVMPGGVPFDQVEAHYSIVDIAPITRRSTPVTETVSPLKPFEAMAMGKVVVSSDVAVMTEIITDGRTGLLFTKNDAASLEAVLERLVTEPDLRQRLGEQARDWVVAERDWKILARRTAAIYRELGVG